VKLLTAGLFKIPHRPNIVVVILVVVVLIAIVEVLVPRVVRIVLRRRPVVVVNKTANEKVHMFYCQKSAFLAICWFEFPSHFNPTGVCVPLLNEALLACKHRSNKDSGN
jgi:hypothetical protein